jgi:hypothetical protein
VVRLLWTSFGCGCSSVVEHHVANVMVVSSNLITRSIFPLVDKDLGPSLRRAIAARPLCRAPQAPWPGRGLLAQPDGMRALVDLAQAERV